MCSVVGELGVGEEWEVINMKMIKIKTTSTSTSTSISTSTSKAVMRWQQQRNRICKRRQEWKRNE